MTTPVVTDLRITIGDWSAAMASEADYDDDGAKWFLGDLDGWWGDHQVISAPVVAPGRDGMIDGDVYFGGRIITAAGHVVAPSRGILQKAMRRVGSLLATGGPEERWQTVVVDEAAAGMELQTVVRLNAGTKVKPAAPLRAEWSISLISEDSWFYGTALRQVATSRYEAGSLLTIPLTVPMVFGAPGSSGFVTVQNDGNTTSWPVVRFVGPLVNPVLRVVGGASVGLLMTINAGEVVDVDMRHGTVMIGDNTREQELMFGSEWLELSPGETVLHFTADGGAGQAVIQWRDAWA